MISSHRKNDRAGGGAWILIHESLDFKEWKDLSISKIDSEILSIQITNKSKNIILSSVYRSPYSNLKEFKSFLKSIFDNIRRNNKSLYWAGDFNINYVDYESNMKIRKLC